MGLGVRGCMLCMVQGRFFFSSPSTSKSLSPLEEYSSKKSFPPFRTPTCSNDDDGNHITGEDADSDVVLLLLMVMIMTS